MIRVRVLASVLLGVFVNGCGGVEMPEIVHPEKCTGLKVTQIDHAVAPPANIAGLIRVTHCDGQVLETRLAPENFSIAEDGHVLPAYEALREIRPTTREVSEVTAIVLDLSGSIFRSGLKERMLEGTQKLIDQLDANRRIAIYGFDGRPNLLPYANFTNDRDELKNALDQIREADLVDDSTNLYGAVVNGLQILDTAVQTEIRNITHVTHGTLVLFTDGTDRAQRVRGYSARMAVQHSPHSTFTIGVGAEIDAKMLRELGRTGHVLVDNSEQVIAAFEEIGHEVTARSMQDYVVSYCSPSRAGTHELTINVNTENHSGHTKIKFHADDFGAGCNPSASLLR